MGIRTTKNKKTEGKKTKQNKWKVTFRSMPRCKPEPKESQSARRSLTRDRGLGLQVASVLPPESWTLGTGKCGFAVSRAVAPVWPARHCLVSLKVEPDRSHTGLDLELEPCLTASVDP